MCSEGLSLSGLTARVSCNLVRGCFETLPSTNQQLLLSQDGFNAERGVEMTEPWNPLNQVPIHEWLTHSQSEEDKCRLRAMGNIVVPYQGRLAGKVLARMEPFLS